ncbi:tRNA preQ1(34) S-adenosylmethionine ribosyltransferase-isomerase QueA [Hwanghaeella grinnelliae]|uniref:S-adenosylmethionine:tRNA ribosyltransferase-isomerase n=1 Tax=Hwanghaeella grinnelliae TaxID=2500179 RepID=A0A437QL33_9PROT|nr:tRNA preQ1(34) S-adenosylmethionine ribosyltransferase-isomerase QueA [Hwanghaeella grinnelliae]RVU35209.1 tRNA preQ1(34) S-adenosylmethionine ribosyltransferase-isomerase QueA [Hwanghaeella grinnelliae]
MKVDLFDFDLPAELIAQHPVEPRDAARMLDLTSGSPVDRIVSALPDLLRPDDVMVVNDTKVIPARLIGRRGQAKVEVTLHRRVDGNRWRAFAKPAKKLKIGDDFVCELGLVGEVVEKFDGGEVELLFPYSGEALLDQIRMQGVMPLPPYIKRQDIAEDAEAQQQDREDYQPIFAKHEGAVAAPTASLHFTDRLLAALEAKGVTRETLTLHVGAGTFLPVKVSDTDDHVMHEEIGILTPEVAERLNAAKAEGRRIVAVGTTALRLLESAADEGGKIHPFDATTDLFITPGYRFKAVDLLLTNFHLPKSTLFMLVSAFAGLERMKAAYEHAKAEGYRFYSYGDCCLLERTE